MPCSPKLKACVDDLIAQGKPESSAWAICRSQLGESRHRDFQRIHDEFVNYYKDVAKGESEYYDWVKTLQLDENSPYGSATEAFRWAKDMISPLKEDEDNKYYQVLVGFPIASMNGNVYKERDLIAAALSLKGKYVSLNHKNEFWFSPKNPENRWGNIPVVDAKYEDNAVEAILQVPKTAVCPICNGDRMTELIDKKRIVNVSLEGNCAGGQCYTGECDGFVFGDPPFSLLTSEVLPGIPLARVKPLESIMVEALQSDETKTKKKKVIKLVAKEQKQKEADYPWDQCISDMKAQGYDDDSAARACAAIKNRTVSHAMEFYGLKTQKEAIDYVLKKCNEDKLFAYELDKFTSKEGMKHVGLSKVIMGDEIQSETTDKAKEATSTTDIQGGECPEGYHQNEAGECIKTVPMTHVGLSTAVTGTPPQSGEELALKAADANVQRIKAEGKAKGMEEQIAKLEADNLKQEKDIHALKTKCEEQKLTIDKLEKQKEQADRDLVEAKADIETWKRKRDEISGSRDDYKILSEKLKAEKEVLEPKYHDALAKNLELTKKLTQANEDYMKVAKELDDTKEALGRAKNEAKKIIRVVP